MQNYTNNIITGDCIDLLSKVTTPFADLIFADPPFNIGYKYDKYKDNVKSHKYIDWTEDWMAACINALKPDGSFYIAIGDDYAAHVRIIGEKLGLTLRNWIIWHYTFGQQTKAKFARSHTHIFYFVKNANSFTFNDAAVRVLSDRQKIYKDKRANPAGKLPDDVWNEFPRICGTFEERQGWHPCQMPESILARIIRASSNTGDLVLDPFSGSGTTPVTAAKLDRQYAGIDISKEYAKETIKRIEAIKTPNQAKDKWHEHAINELKWLHGEIKLSTSQLAQSPFLQNLFTEKFNVRMNTSSQYTTDEVMAMLTTLSKNAKLGPVESKKLST